MPGFPFPLPFRQFDNAGNPLSGGRVYSYEAGTQSLLPTFTDQALTVPHDNPMTLSAYGDAEVYIEDGVAYDLVIKDRNGVTIRTLLDYSVPAIPIVTPTDDTPPGSILMFGGAFAPAGFLVCDGTAYSRSTYAALFANIGTYYGVGNGTTTFNVPDFRQRFPMGQAVSGTGALMGSSGGAIDHLHTGPSHTHTVASHLHTIAHTHSVPKGGWSTAVNTPPLAGILQAGGSGSGSESSASQATADNTSGASSAANSGGTALTTDASGTGNTGTANPPFLVAFFIIKY